MSTIKKEKETLNKVAKVLGDKEKDFKVSFLSEEVQFEITVGNQNIVINSSHEKGKDVVVFIGDLCIDLTLGDFEKFIDNNAYLGANFQLVSLMGIN